MDPVWDSLTDDEEFAELITLNVVQRPRAPRLYDGYLDHWTDAQFVERFRLSKNGFSFVLERVRPFLPDRSDQRGLPVPHEAALLMALNFFASGSFMRVVGDNHKVSKMTVSRYIKIMSEALASLYWDVVKLPETQEDFQRLRTAFHALSRFPFCVGALDCTHVRIQSPSRDIGEMFRNRKGYFSMNVQAVCDAELRFMDVVANWPGSAHDANILANSALRWKMETFHPNVIIADSGYPLSDSLIIKLANPQTHAEQLFNEALVRTRNVVERAFGVWKRRFPVLANGLRVKKEKLEAIIIATAVLHNLAIDLNETLPSVTDDTQINIDETAFHQRQEVHNAARIGPRERFIRFFSTL